MTPSPPSRVASLGLAKETVGPPSLAMPAPFVAVFVLEQRATAEWQAEISRWIVDSGCRYAVAWGIDCSSWDTSIDVANLEKFNFGDIPDELFVMTTWHEDQELAEALWFAKYNAFHPVVDLEYRLLVHVAVEAREQELLGEFARA